MMKVVPSDIAAATGRLDADRCPSWRVDKFADDGCTYQATFTR
jgi:hypothetical protein